MKKRLSVIIPRYQDEVSGTAELDRSMSCIV